MTGAQATAVERLQNAYENTPGFMAAVSDGTHAYVVVDAATLADWKTRLTGTDTRVAPSCVDPRLVKAAQSTIEQASTMPGDFWASGYDATQDAVVISTNIDADLVRQWITATAPGVPFDDQTLRINYADSGCRGVGLDATMTGDPTDPRVVWLQLQNGKQLNTVWPPGWTARFSPALEVLDPRGTIRYRQGDAVTGGCVTSDPNTLEIDGE